MKAFSTRNGSALPLILYLVYGKEFPAARLLPILTDTTRSTDLDSHHSHTVVVLNVDATVLQQYCLVRTTRGASRRRVDARLCSAYA